METSIIHILELFAAMILWHSFINASISLDFFVFVSLPGAPVGVKIAGVPAPVSDAAPAAEVFKVYQLLKGWSHLSGYVDWDQC